MKRRLVFDVYNSLVRRSQMGTVLSISEKCTFQSYIGALLPRGGEINFELVDLLSAIVAFLTVTVGQRRV